MRIIKFVSTFTPIRTACGDLGMSGVMQTLEEDLVRWAVEAQDLIGVETGLQNKSGDFIVKNNKIRYCADMKIIDCVSINGEIYDYEQRNECNDLVTNTCPCKHENSKKIFTADNCFITFSPEVADGTTIKIKYMARQMDENGYPKVADICVVAIQEYIKWKLCFRYRDNRNAECQRRWYELCKQARSQYNKLTQQQVEYLGHVYINQRI